MLTLLDSLQKYVCNTWFCHSVQIKDLWTWQHNICNGSLQGNASNISVGLHNPYGLGGVRWTAFHLYTFPILYFFSKFTVSNFSAGYCFRFIICVWSTNLWGKANKWCFYKIGYSWSLLPIYEILSYPLRLQNVDKPSCFRRIRKKKENDKRRKYWN
jgi:hypothetical protein